MDVTEECIIIITNYDTEQSTALLPLTIEAYGPQYQGGNKLYYHRS